MREEKAGGCGIQDRKPGHLSYYPFFFWRSSQQENQKDGTEKMNRHKTVLIVPKSSPTLFVWVTDDLSEEWHEGNQPLDGTEKLYVLLAFYQAAEWELALSSNQPDGPPPSMALSWDKPPRMKVGPPQQLRGWEPWGPDQTVLRRATPCNRPQGPRAGPEAALLLADTMLLPALAQTFCCSPREILRYNKISLEV